MDIRPLYTEEDYQEVLRELMAFEAQGWLLPIEFRYIEIMCELLDAFDAKHDSQHCYLAHCKHHE